MNASSNCYEVLQYCEQCRLKSYPDPASPLAKAIRAGLPTAGLSGAPWTAGWGCTDPSITPSTIWTQTHADAMLINRMTQEFEPGVKRLLMRPTTQGQMDCFLDFAWNLGLDALKHSTMLSDFNRGKNLSARAQLLTWINAGGQPMLGLRRRRAMDAALWDGLTGKQAIAIGAAIH